jgi:hypothetical protein
LPASAPASAPASEPASPWRSRYFRHRADRAQPAEATAPPVFGPGASWDDFSAVADRNIFVKERSSRSARGDFNSQFASSQASAIGLVLTGLSMEEANQENVSRWVALFDDPQTGRMARASAGDVLDGGRVLDVSLDGVDYEKAGSTRRLALGQSLSGRAVDMANPPAPASQDANMPATAPGPGGGDSFRERYFRRHHQEMAP